MQQIYFSTARSKILLRVLCIDSAFDGVSFQADILLGKIQALSCCNANLPLDQVIVGDHLGHGMLHLQTGVHLHKVKGIIVL